MKVLWKGSREFVELFRSKNVKFLLVGGYAMACHGAPRFTEDIDLLILATKENARLVIEVLGDFGFGELRISDEDLVKPQYIVQLARIFHKKNRVVVRSH